MDCILAINVCFMLTQQSYIQDLSEEQFQKHVEALADRRLEKPKKMSSQSSRYWSEIISQQYNFDRGNNKMLLV